MNCCRNKQDTNTVLCLNQKKEGKGENCELRQKNHKDHLVASIRDIKLSFVQENMIIRRYTMYRIAYPMNRTGIKLKTGV